MPGVATIGVKAAQKDLNMLNRMILQEKEYRSVFELYMSKASTEIKRFQDIVQYGKTRVWQTNAIIRKDIDVATKELAQNLKGLIELDINYSWNLSNQQTDAMVRQFIGDQPLTRTITDGWFTRNSQALDGFIARKNALGLNLSDRVWNIAQEARTQLDFYVKSGIATGRSAAGIAGDLNALLQNPDKLFHRVRDAAGNLVPSAPMAAYHPGRGVYRSAYKNALRLAGTETNMAYNLADWERWQKLDFVIGIEIHISNNHPVEDICDDCAGKYDKDFIFIGWHPCCRCFATAITQDMEGFIADIKNRKNTATRITGVPDGMLKWMEANGEKIAGMENPPYWYSVNSTKGTFNFTTSALRRQL